MVGCYAALALSFAALALQSGAAQDQKPTFQSRTLLVPIEVRVLDAKGKPVTDLAREDFEVFEDGVKQQITLFEHLNLGAIGPDRVGEVRPEERRAFLILMPRVWLTSELFGATEAFTRFVREHLLPQDLVAFSAWGRTTPLTTNHEEVARVIERLKKYQEGVNRGPDRGAKSRELYAIAAGFTRTPETEAELDALFEVNGERPRTNGRARAADVRNVIEPLRARADGLQAYASGSLGHGTTSGDILSATIRDIAGAVFYLRRFAGEKHLIYASPSGLRLPAIEDDRNVARLASDSRVVLHIVQTGGINPGAHATGAGALFDRMSSQMTAELTGGRAFFYQYPREAITQIDAATRSGYLLGYYPSHQAQDNRHRKLTVRVARVRGATVLFRKSYRMGGELATVDDFDSQDRIMAAAEQSREFKDVPVTFSASATAGSVEAVAQIDLRQVHLNDVEGRRKGTVSLAFFCTDPRQRLVGEFWQDIDLNLRPETYEMTAAEGLRHSVKFPVKARPGYCKVVIYDPQSDRVGSAITRLK